MTIRQLPFEEWDRLDGFPIATNGLPNPDTSVIFVIESAEGEIVGTWEAITPVILEGLWLRDDYRRTTAMGRLLSEMKSFLRSIHVDKAFTLVQTSDVLELAHKAGFETIPGEFLVLDLDKVQ